MRTTCLLAGITLTALFSSGAAFGADPRLMNLVMPDATTLAGANVTNAKITPFGQFVLAQITAAMNQQLQTFVTATGFDPRQDVSEVLAASSGTAASGSGLVLALGNFQVAQITAAIAAKSPQLTVQTYGGATLITGGAAKNSFSIAFFGNLISAAGDTASVKAAIDRSTGVNSINPALATQVQALSTTEDAWVVTDSPVSTLLAGLEGSAGAGAASPIAGMTQIFNSILGSSGGVKFGSSVQITGQANTTDAASAKSIADVMTALVSIAGMSGQTTGQPGGELASFAKLLQGMTVTASGTTINLALSIPEAQLESFLNAMNTPKPAVKRATQRAIRPAITRPDIAVN